MTSPNIYSLNKYIININSCIQTTLTSRTHIHIIPILFNPRTNMKNNTIDHYGEFSYPYRMKNQKPKQVELTSPSHFPLSSIFPSLKAYLKSLNSL
jgi:predicted neuraminidase